MATIRIQETDTMGVPIQTYALTTVAAAGETASPSRARTRLDLIPTPTPTATTPVPKSTPSKFGEEASAVAAPLPLSLFSSVLSFLSRHLATLFLPIGYPHTVTADYTPYQIYDSLQAFASSISGLLSSRAVLQSMGFDTDGAASTATYATLVSIVQSTVSNLSTILFANYASSRISSEVKFYRFLADIVNDVAFLLDMVSPSLPVTLRVPSLCLSSAFRAVCGVAGGSSKAVLSAHFAVDGNIGELNAKDGSQETVVGLVGMWIGGVVVSRVESLWATWCWMIGLMVLHLSFNYLAVRSVRLRGLNLGRAGRVLEELVRSGRCRDVEEVGKAEGVFEQGGMLRDSAGRVVARGKIGVGLIDLIESLGGHTQARSGSTTVENTRLQRLLRVFEEEQYLLWLVTERRQAILVFKDGASRDSQLKAWCHAIRAAAECDWQEQDLGENDGIIHLISNTLSTNNEAWQEFRRRIEDAGWNVSGTMLESTPGRRFKLL